jgi:hypothetical protein
MVVTREDDAYLLGKTVLKRLGVANEFQREVIAGNDVRDWTFGAGTVAICTYNPDGVAQTDSHPWVDSTPSRRMFNTGPGLFD